MLDRCPGSEAEHAESTTPRFSHGLKLAGEVAGYKSGKPYRVDTKARRPTVTAKLTHGCVKLLPQEAKR